MPLFKNIVIYRIANIDALPSLEQLENAAASNAFAECGPTQASSAGFVPPRGSSTDALVESIGGQLMFQLKSESKSVPGAAVKAELEKRVLSIEAETGRKPGRKERAGLKEDIVLEMLPRAFSKFSTNLAWIDRKNGLVVIGAGSHRGGENFITHFLRMLDVAGFQAVIHPLNTEQSPSGAMAAWLVAQECPEGFELGREVELKSTDEEKASVRYAHHNLALDEVKEHIRNGKAPTRLALSWDGRVSFMFTPDMCIKKLEFLRTTEGSAEDDGFDADVVLSTGELVELFPALFAALGGEVVRKEEGTHESSAERV